MRYHQFKQQLKEGGNVFKAPGWTKISPEMRTDRIHKSEVPMTTKFLEKLTGLSLKDNLLGSTGIAESSGDMDIAVDMNAVSKDDLVAHLTEQGVSPDDIRKTGDSVHYCSPIYGPNGKTDRLVQVDFMFVPSVEFARWSMRTAPDSTYKGKYLQQLRADLVNTMAPKDDAGKSQWKWNHFSGVLNRSDNSPVFKAYDPDDIAKGLLGKQATRADLESVERVIKALKTHEKRGEVVNTYRQTLARSPKEPQLPPDEELDEGRDDDMEQQALEYAKSLNAIAAAIEKAKQIKNPARRKQTLIAIGKAIDDKRQEKYKTIGPAVPPPDTIRALSKRLNDEDRAKNK